MGFTIGDLLEMIKQGQNPEQLVMYILEQRMGSTPIGANLLSLAKQNKGVEIEQVVRNIFKSKGLDFDKEFNAFKQHYGL